MADRSDELSLDDGWIRYFSILILASISYFILLFGWKQSIKKDLVNPCRFALESTIIQDQRKSQLRTGRTFSLNQSQILSS